MGNNSTHQRVTNVFDSNDSFESTINKSYKMSRAKNVDDIPKDANIFVFNNKTRVELPAGTKAKECILSDKELSTFTKMFRDTSVNNMNLNSIEANYVHGSSTSDDLTYGRISLNNSKVNQLGNIQQAQIKNSRVGYINDVGNLNVEHSILGEVNVRGVLNLDGHTQANRINAYTVVTFPEDKVNNVEAEYITCKRNKKTPNKYSNIETAHAKVGADLCQTKIKNLQTSELILKDSIADNVNAEYGVVCNNSLIKDLKIGRIHNLSNCKINNFEIKSPRTRLKIHNKAEINNLTLNDNDAKLFVDPHLEWGQKNNNYINKIKIQNCKKSNSKPVLKIQGDIKIGTVEFKDKAGILELTRPKNNDEKIKVINGKIKYNVPEEDMTQEDLDMDI